MSARTFHVGTQPVGCSDTPAIAGLESGKSVLRVWGREVVSDSCLVRKELSGHDRTDRMASQVAGCSVAAAITKPAGERIGAALFEWAAEDVQCLLVVHPRSMPVATDRRQPGTGSGLGLDSGDNGNIHDVVGRCSATEVVHHPSDTLQQRPEGLGATEALRDLVGNVA